MCPTCGGNFETRPIRPATMVKKYPVLTKKLIAPKDLVKAQKLIDTYGDTPPQKR